MSRLALVLAGSATVLVAAAVTRQFRRDDSAARARLDVVARRVIDSNHGELIDALGIDQLDVVAFSAGSTSALQFALRHPDRIRHLVVLSGDWPGAFSTAPPPVEKLVYQSDLLMWLAKTLAGRSLFRLVAGIPKGFPLTEPDKTQVRAIIDSIFPVRDRSTGVIFDAYVGNSDVDTYPLEAINAPTLIVHSRDDTLASFEPAESAAARIPHAQLLAHDTGGHLQLGRADQTRHAVQVFLLVPTQPLLV